MNHELIYFLKVNIAIALFYAFYRLFFYRDTFFLWRRISLLAFVLISLVYPLFNIQDWIKEQGPMIAMADLYSTVILPEISVDGTIENAGFSWNNIISISFVVLYVGGMFILISHFLIQLAGIIRLGIGTRSCYINNTKVHILTKPQGPFSFFKWIFIYPSAHTEREAEEILTHELTHVRQWHSIDVILSELICILCWFNPFIWLLKREVRNNLEYLADHKVLENGHDHRIYQYHLLGLAHQKAASHLSNNFNILPLKNRIKMMNKKRTKQIERTKYLLFLPLIALLLITSNIETVARNTGKVIDSIFTNEVPGKIEDYKVHVDIIDEEIIETETTSPIYSEPSVPTNIQLTEPTPAEVPEVIHSELPEPIRPEVSEPEEISADHTIFEIVENMPEYPGGQHALMQYLSMNIRYPLMAQQNGTQGRVIVQFVVDKDGSISEPSVVRKVSPELDKEAIRVIQNMPNWMPGKQRGKPVRVKYTVPVMFRLQ